MYPHPASNLVNIGNPKLLEFAGISEYDIRGRLFQKESIGSALNTYPKDVSRLSSSVYRVTINFKDVASTTKRLIKKKKRV
jgi:hypothetical protein